MSDAKDVLAVKGCIEDGWDDAGVESVLNDVFSALGNDVFVESD
jgi:hypothetical protein